MIVSSCRCNGLAAPLIAPLYNYTRLIGVVEISEIFPATQQAKEIRSAQRRSKEHGGSSAAPKPPPPYAHAARSRFLRSARPASRRLTPTLTSGSAAGKSWLCRKGLNPPFPACSTKDEGISPRRRVASKTWGSKRKDLGAKLLEGDPSLYWGRSPNPKGQWFCSARGQSP